MGLLAVVCMKWVLRAVWIFAWSSVLSVVEVDLGASLVGMG